MQKYVKIQVPVTLEVIVGDSGNQTENYRTARHTVEHSLDSGNHSAKVVFYHHLPDWHQIPLDDNLQPIPFDRRNFYWMIPTAIGMTVLIALVILGPALIGYNYFLPQNEHPIAAKVIGIYYAIILLVLFGVLMLGMFGRGEDKTLKYITTDKK